LQVFLDQIGPAETGRARPDSKLSVVACLAFSVVAGGRPQAKSFTPGMASGRLSSNPFSASVTTIPSRPAGSNAALVGFAPGRSKALTNSPRALNTLSWPERNTA